MKVHLQIYGVNRNHTIKGIDSENSLLQQDKDRDD